MVLVPVLLAVGALLVVFRVVKNHQQTARA
jgi:hypothetical protein